jgi:hypothetical protein
MGKGNCEKRGQPGKKGEIQKIEKKRNIKGKMKKGGGGQGNHKGGRAVKTATVN